VLQRLARRLGLLSCDPAGGERRGGERGAGRVGRPRMLRWKRTAPRSCRLHGLPGGSQRDIRTRPEQGTSTKIVPLSRLPVERRRPHSMEPGPHQRRGYDPGRGPRVRTPAGAEDRAWLPPCERQSGLLRDLGERSETAADLQGRLTVARRCCPWCSGGARPQWERARLSRSPWAVMTALVRSLGRADATAGRTTGSPVRPW
jgi:hypothetical protein